jgi:hypothetical protein
MKVSEKVKVFLSETPNISLGYRELEFFGTDRLDQEQMGYRFDTKNRSLITGQEGDWQEAWIVIGTDDLGDPIIVDMSEPDLKVMSAMHGEGEWEPYLIAESLEKFKAIILELKKISKNRTNPVALEKNPIKNQERKQFIKAIEEANPNIDVDYWDSILEAE